MRHMHAAGGYECPNEAGRKDISHGTGRLGWETKPSQTKP